MSTSAFNPAQAATSLPHPSPPSPPTFPFHVRSFQPRDLTPARSLFTLTSSEFGPLASMLIAHTMNSDMADISAHYIEPPRSHFFCAVEADDVTLVGIVGLRPMSVADPKLYAEMKEQGKEEGEGEGEGDVPWEDVERVLELNRMAVSPLARRRGVARALNAECVAFARQVGACGIHLSTLIGIGAARSMYLSLGYREYRTTRFHIGKGGEDGGAELQEHEKPKKSLSPEEIPSDAVMADMRQRLSVWHAGRYYLPV